MYTIGAVSHTSSAVPPMDDQISPIEREEKGI